MVTASVGVAYAGTVDLVGVTLPVARVDVRTAPASVIVQYGPGSACRTVAHVGARAVFVEGELLVELANGDTVVLHDAVMLDD